MTRELAGSQNLVKRLRKIFPRRPARKLPRDIRVFSLPAKESAFLNRRFRGKKKPANVLSFSYGPEYGEILLCPEAIRAEAVSAREPYALRVTRMVLHGMVHLSGLHHEKSAAEAGRAEKLEEKILQKIHGKEHHRRA